MSERCTAHGNVVAAWKCRGCERALCERCCARQAIAGVSGEGAELCVHCGGFAARKMVPKRVAPYWEKLGDFVKTILSTEGLMQLGAIALVRYLVELLGLIGFTLSTFIFVSYYFRVISSFAMGAERLPEPEDFLGPGSLFGPVLRFTAATCVIWVPALVYLILVPGPSAFLQNPLGTMRDPAFLLLLLLGFIYAPAAIIAAAVAENVLAVFNPLITVRMILRIPIQYLGMTFIWIGLYAASWIVDSLLDGVIDLVPIPVVVPLLAQFVTLLLPVFSAMVMGRLIYQNGEHFGMKVKDDETEPEVKGARPKGKLTEAADPKDESGESAPVASAELPAGAQIVAGMPLGTAPDAKPTGSTPDLSAGLALGLSADLSPAGSMPAPSPLAPAPLGPSPFGSSPPGSSGPVESDPSIDLELPEDGALVLELDPAETGIKPAVAGSSDDLELPDDLEFSLPDDDLDVRAAPAVDDLSLDVPPAPPAEASPVEVHPDQPTPLRPVDPEQRQRERLEGISLQLSEVLEAGHVEGALALFNAEILGRAYPRLDQKNEIRLSGVLERAGLYQEAMFACQRAAKADMKGALAPRAIFSAARLMEERLSDLDGARTMYGYLIKHYPSDALATNAQARLKALQRS